MIDEIILAYGSIPRGDETLMILSFTGAKFSFSFHTKQAQTLSVSLITSCLSNSISIKTFTHSPVAAGEVIALEKVFGTVIPRDAKIGITIIVVSFPGTHQIQYFPATTHGKRYISPVYAVALVVYANSCISDL
jgi:hypothetical protein